MNTNYIKYTITINNDKKIIVVKIMRDIEDKMEKLKALCLVLCRPHEKPNKKIMLKKVVCLIHVYFVNLLGSEL